MPHPEVSVKSSRLLLLATIFLVVASLYLAQDILKPIALAVILSFLLAPAVRRLERMKLPRAVAVMGTVLLAFSAIGAVGYVVYDQLYDIGSHLTEYQNNVQNKLRSVHSNDGMVSHLEKAYQQVSTIHMGAATKPAVTTGPSTQPAPMHVIVENTTQNATPPDQRPLALIESVGGNILGPAGKTFLVIVLTIFMLFQREELRDRVIRLVGRGQLTVTTEALDEAAARVSRYLTMQSLINGSEGVIVMVGLWTIGRINHHPFPSPALWGLLAALMRFIPYIGIWISATMPTLIALATFPSIGPTIETAGLYVVMELTVSNSIEPYLLGSSTGIAALAVLVAATFWTWLWGPIGLLLSTPLTVVLVVLGRYVPQFEFLSIILGDDPALSPAARVYQRLLALDHEEAEELVQQYAKKMPLQQLYADVLLPALVMLRWDVRRDHLDEKRHEFIRSGLRGIVEQLGEQHKAKGLAAAAETTVVQARGQTPEVASTHDAAGRFLLPAGCEINVLVLPAHDADDEIAATMLSQLLDVQGYCVVNVSADRLASEAVDQVEAVKPAVVFVSALPPSAGLHARYFCKRLHARWPDLSVLIGLWAVKGEPQRIRERLDCGENARVATTLADALSTIHQLIQPRLIAPEAIAAAAGPLRS